MSLRTGRGDAARWGGEIWAGSRVTAAGVGAAARLRPMDQDLLKRRRELRETCRPLLGHVRETPSELMRAAADWLDERGADPDVYGTGEELQAFEQRVAELLGFEAARFMPSGSMAQPIALRIWCERARLPHFGMHPTSHVELHEERGYAHLHGLRASLIGPAQSPLLAEHLEACPEALAVLLTELPIREAGGQLPTWEQLGALKTAAIERGVPLHLDGARLWECAPAYGRSLAEICEGFDSAYVSFYKGIGALPGSMLLGDAEFIAEAKLWQRRQGGVLYTLSPGLATAAAKLDERLAAMPAWHARAGEVAAVLNGVKGVRTLPDPPHTNLFHVFLDLDPEAALAARDVVAARCGLWLFQSVRAADKPGTSRFEWTVGQPAIEVSDADLRGAWETLLEDQPAAPRA